MSPGLFRFGTDFGNAAADRTFFPRDDTTAEFLAQKARVLAVHPARNAQAPSEPGDLECLAAAEAWFRTTLVSEGQSEAATLPLERLGTGLVEDFAVLRAAPGAADRVLLLHACFPSGWRPEHVLGQSFAAIHAPIPGFSPTLSSASSLVEAMVTRGPYIRFVWTITADAELDHHPEQGGRAPWTEHVTRGYLRVERQVTVPLPAERAAVFLIRTYLYGFDELSQNERDTLAISLLRMPEQAQRYKRLEAAIPHALRLLGTR